MNCVNEYKNEMKTTENRKYKNLYKQTKPSKAYIASKHKVRPEIYVLLRSQSFQDTFNDRITVRQRACLLRERKRVCAHVSTRSSARTHLTACRVCMFESVYSIAIYELVFKELENRIELVLFLNVLFCFVIFFFMLCFAFLFQLMRKT